MHTHIAELDEPLAVPPHLPVAYLFLILRKISRESLYLCLGRVSNVSRASQYARTSAARSLSPNAFSSVDVM